jgi:hypothetical protein
VSGEADKLGYSYTPVANWIFQAWENGVMSDEARHLHEALFQAAPTRVLKERGEFRILRRALAQRCRRKDNDAFTKLIRREQERGRFRYRVEGHASIGVYYVFALFPDGPVRAVSEQEPVRKARSKRSSNRSMSAPVGDRSGQNAALSDQKKAARPHQATDSAPPAELAGPISLDAVEKPTTRSEENLVGRASPNHASPVGKGTQDTSEVAAPSHAKAHDPEPLWRTYDWRAARARLQHGQEQQDEVDRIVEDYGHLIDWSSRNTAARESIKRLPEPERDLLLELIDQLDAVEVVG